MDGVEVSATMLSHAARRFRRDIATGRLRLHAASMTELPLATDSLDGAITLNTIYFICELDLAFAELARVTKRSGRVVIGLGDPAAMAGTQLAQHKAVTTLGSDWNDDSKPFIWLTSAAEIIESPAMSCGL